MVYVNDISINGSLQIFQISMFRCFTDATRQDGLAGWCDRSMQLCLGLALWNGKDSDYSRPQSSWLSEIITESQPLQNTTEYYNVVPPSYKLVYNPHQL